MCDHWRAHAVRYFLGVNRDAAPFVFPSGFAVLMGGEDGIDAPNFRKFEDLCCDLFLTLRRRSGLFITLVRCRSATLSSRVEQ